MRFVLKDQGSDWSYQWLSRLVVPRPIALVSTLSASGEANLGPFSFFMLGGMNPPSLAFCPTRGVLGEDKDTAANIRETGEFVVNLVHATIAANMNLTGVAYARDVDEWPISGLTPAKSTVIRPARVAESLVQMECQCHMIIDHGDGPHSSSYVIGEILVLHVDESLVTESGLGTFKPISRLGGHQYLDMDGGKVFDMVRPKPMDPSSDGQ